jgi:hypothetical protein
LFGWRVHVVKLLIMKFSSVSYYFILLWSKYSPQYPAFKHHQSMVFP